MSGNKFQIKRTGISGRQPNTTNSSNSAYIDVGELALNFSDHILYTSDGNTAIEIGANVTHQNITGSLTANGSVGSSGQVLTSNGSGIYWGTGETDLLSKTTDDLNEGNTNLYFTDSRVVNTVETQTVNSISVGLTKQQTNTAITDGSNSEILSQWSLIDFFSSKAIITAIGEGKTQISEFLITHDGTNAHMIEYGVLTTHENLFTANSYIDGNNLIISVTSTLTTDTTFTIHETLFVDQVSAGFNFNTDLQAGDGHIDLERSFGTTDLNE